MTRIRCERWRVGGSVGFSGSVPGAARLHLLDGVSLLRPEEQVFRAMLAGFANQQLARNLAARRWKAVRARARRSPRM